MFSSTIESAGHFSGQPSSYIGNGYSLANRLPDLRQTQLSPFFLSLEIDGLSRSSPLKPLYWCLWREREYWRPFLGLAKNSLSCHQKTQRSKEVKVSLCLCTELSWELLEPQGSYALDLLHGGQTQPRELSLLPGACSSGQGFGKGSPLSWIDREDNCLWGIVWLQLEVNSSFKIASYLPEPPLLASFPWVSELPKKMLTPLEQLIIC